MAAGWPSPEAEIDCGTQDAYTVLSQSLMGVPSLGCCHHSAIDHTISLLHADLRMAFKFTVHDLKT